ncbi:beta-lactamase-like protein [Suillus clintonianus]|uniref:beta-lactamase-like protein n=1 Tax=Suillus clintonianus TaxID=1904413 RepID=UPI001B8708F8|nr:beta-lactamase-like protein [Suillus clintonianus]KAG2145138.1 beta-lactamase-like protein [Suillus clintonianus]
MSLPSPVADQAYMNISALEAGSLNVPLQNIVAGSSPTDFIRNPSLAFLLCHSKSGHRVVFDLGIRRDINSLPPAVRWRIQYFDFQPEVPQDVAESLKAGGTLPEQIDTVIVSHLHWDHVGDPEPFKNATFVVGERCREILAAGYPVTEDAPFSSTAIPVERTRFLSELDMNSAIGPYPDAIDYFGDGSMYIVDAPGHIGGHVNILARTSAEGSWLLLGGDSAGDFRLITGEKEIGHYSDVNGCFRCIHVDKELALENIRRIRGLLSNPKVQVLIAHDVPWYKENKGGPAFYPGVIPAKT